MEIHTKYIVSETVPPQARTAEQLVAEGKHLLDSGDKPRALANLVMATNLSPDNETAWLLRAKASDDPVAAAESLEHVLSINPQNAQAREELIYLRMHSLQAGVRAGTDARVAANETGTRASVRRLANNQFVRMGILVFALIFCGLSSVTLAAMYALLNNAAGAGVIAAQRPSATPTVKPFQLPPTWTPSPTSAPTRTPLPSPTPSGRTKTSLTVRAGPGINFPRLGTAPPDSTLAIIGRSSDGKYFEIEYPDADKPGWVWADSVELGGAALDDLAITTPLPITLAPTRPPKGSVPASKPSATPLPSSPWAYIVNPRGCQHSGGTFIEGVVTNLYGEEAGARVILGTSPGANVIQTIITGSDRSPGYYTFVLNANGADPSTYYAWIADASGKALSDPNAARVTTNAIKNSDDPNSCWQAFVDFARR